VSEHLTASQRRRTLLTGAVALGLMSVAAAVTLAAAAVTLFRLRRFYVEGIARGFSLLLLRVCGVRLVVHRDRPWPAKQTVYVSNHTSALDVFVLIALGLPNTRFFLSGFLRAVLPLGVLGHVAGTFWTVPQSRPADRTRLFERAERVLRRTAESVYLSPEGARIRTGEIGPFNKGAFHLAGNLGAPILPLYLAVPLPPWVDRVKAAEPTPYTVRDNLMSFLGDVRPCVVHVHVDTPIDTSGWRLEDLDRNRQQVRQRFLAMHEQWKAG
jgi:1-acyl-sn-glycerol-3-phosphate acyltransferase